MNCLNNKTEILQTISNYLKLHDLTERLPGLDFKEGIEPHAGPIYKILGYNTEDTKHWDAFAFEIQNALKYHNKYDLGAEYLYNEHKEAIEKHLV